MRLWIPGFVLSCVCLAFGSMAQAVDQPAYRPCGAGQTWGGNRLIPQMSFGADFRPACQAHDTCEGTNRECDKIFLKNMYCACETSKHPLLCRMQARHYYITSRIYHMIPRPIRQAFRR